MHGGAGGGLARESGGARPPLWMDGMGVGVDGEWTRVVLVVVVVVVGGG